MTMLEQLRDQVTAVGPRMFALYGAFRRDPETTFIGWGVELTELNKAYLWGSTGTYLAASAEQIVKTHEIFGDTELVWLDLVSLDDASEANVRAAREVVSAEHDQDPWQDGPLADVSPC